MLAIYFRGSQHTKGSASTYDASCEAREGIPARPQQFRPMLQLRKGDDILLECLSKPFCSTGFTDWLYHQRQRYPGAVWTTELLLEPVAMLSSGHRQLAGRPAMPDLGQLLDYNIFSKYETQL